tara:strand:+ start:2600 stop:2872 length:273 start_codon:yes stop_codon:yes gene_type:complete
MTTQTVAQVLKAGVDSATLINGIDDGSIVRDDLTQEEINTLVQQNVDHLELILAYDGTNETPNVVGSSNSKKTTCSDAVATGKAYIESNT